MLDKLEEMNDISYKEFGDPEINTKIQQYEMAYRMQTAVPDITDVSKEPDDIVKMYGPDCLLPGTYAAICFVILVSVVFFMSLEKAERWLRPVN